MGWNAVPPGWTLGRHAENLRWAHDDSGLAMWGVHRFDRADERWESADTRALYYGPVGGALAYRYETDAIEDLAWRSAAEIALLCQSSNVWSRARYSIELIALPTGDVRARQEALALDSARLQWTTDGRLFLHDRRFPATGHQVTILDPQDLHTLGTLCSAPTSATGRTWIAPDGGHFVLHVRDRDHAHDQLMLDAEHPLPLPHGGHVQVEWLSRSRFAVRDTKAPQCTVSVFDVARTTPLYTLTPDHHPDVSVDIDASGTRALVCAEPSLTLVDLDTGITQRLDSRGDTERIKGARWLDARGTRIAVLTRPARPWARLSVWDMGSRKLAEVATIALTGTLGTVQSEIVLERSPAGRYLEVRWWAHEGQSVAVFPVDAL